jgi:MerR family transcriptional regulator, light-induced transcriptional regulator
VKAHTIRIWERRYNLLEPDRTGSNYRHYSLDELKTILNVAFLVNHGIKISKVAAMPVQEREIKVREISAARTEMGGTLNSLKMAMLTFDETLFRQASQAFREKEGFNALVEGVYVPLLEHIGHLWHSGTICPSQEHFVSNLIRQRIVSETEALPLTESSERMFVLFLPDQEIHELGLLYTNYLLRSFGHRTIYLGQSVPSDDLHQIAGMFSGPITYIAFITSFPTADRLQQFMDGLRAQIPDPQHRFWFTGAQVNRAEGLVPPSGFRVFPHIKGMIEAFVETP